MDALYRNKLRYLVARYGYSTAVLSWEFWNEVDLVDAYKTETVRQWHQRMAQYLRSIDPYCHLITTSYGRSVGDREVDVLPELDYVQTHHYGSPDIAVTLARQQADKAAYGKPHYVGEIGADSGGARFEDDPNGMQIHDPLWVTLATGGSGLAAPWYWELIHTSNLYGMFGNVSRFVKGIDWAKETIRTIVPRLEWQTRPQSLPRKDLVLEAGPVTWLRDEYALPRTVQITRDGAKGEVPVAGIQHGIQNHRDKHNPVMFEVDLPWTTRLLVDVAGVSGFGGAALRVELDGKLVLQKEFIDTNPPGKHETIKEYDKAYSIDIPTGRHTVRVENTGKDWFLCSFRFAQAIEASGPPLLAWAVTGENTTIAWVRIEERIWRRVCALKEVIPSVPPSILVLPDIRTGDWQVEVWDTWNGRVIQSQRLSVPATGEARVTLPIIEKDVAVRLNRIK